jgi:hypothetical protein
VTQLAGLEPRIFFEGESQLFGLGGCELNCEPGASSRLIPDAESLSKALDGRLGKSLEADQSRGGGDLADRIAPLSQPLHLCVHVRELLAQTLGADAELVGSVGLARGVLRFGLN